MVREMEKPDTPLPDPGAMTVADYAQISRRFLEHFPIEARKENRLQASEKVWGAVSHAISAVAEQNDWPHGNYGLKKKVAEQIGVELAEADPAVPTTEADRDAYVNNIILQPYAEAYALHINFHENTMGLQGIKKSEAVAAGLIETLNQFRENGGSSEYIPQYEADQERVALLKRTSTKPRDYRRDYPIGVPVKWNNGHTGGSGGGVPAGKSPSPKSPSPTALRRRERDEGDTVVEPVRGKSPRRRRKEPQAAAAAQSSRPGRERRQVIKPRPAAQRQSRR